MALSPHGKRGVAFPLYGIAHTMLRVSEGTTTNASSGVATLPPPGPSVFPWEARRWMPIPNDPPVSDSFRYHWVRITSESFRIGCRSVVLREAIVNGLVWRQNGNSHPY